MEISTESSINDGVLLTSSKNKSSVDGIIKDASNQMMNLTQARDDIDVLHEEIEITEERHTIFVSAIKDVTTESGSRKQSTSLQEVGQNKAPVALYRSRTDKKSSPVSEDIVTPASLHRSRTATPQISSKRSSPTFSDMMTLLPLSREKSIKSNTLSQPEEIEEVASKEEEDEEKSSVSADSSVQISGEVNALSGVIVATDEEVSTVGVAPPVKDPVLQDQAANEDDADEGFVRVAIVEEAEEAEEADVELKPEEVKVTIKPEEVEVVLKTKEVEVESEPEEEFAQVESEPEEEFAQVESEPEEEFAQVESEPEEEFARVVEMPSVAEDNSFKSSSKKSKWLKKMRGCLAKK